MALTRAQKNRILRHIYSFGKFEKEEIKNIGNKVSYSFVGHSADPEIKKNFDPDKILRNRILRNFPFRDKELTVKVEGDTCLDYMKNEN